MSKPHYACASFQTIEEVPYTDWDYMQDGINKVQFNTVWYYNVVSIPIGPGEMGYKPALQFRIYIYAQHGLYWSPVTHEHQQLNSIRVKLNERAVRQINDSAAKRYRELNPYIGKYEHPTRHPTNRHPIYPYGDF